MTYKVEVFLTLFPKPPFFIRIEKGVHQVVTIILRNFKRFCFYAIVKTLQGKRENNQKQAAKKSPLEA